jgi:hypothetical protein
LEVAQHATSGVFGVLLEDAMAAHTWNDGRRKLVVNDQFPPTGQDFLSLARASN